MDSAQGCGGYTSSPYRVGGADALGHYEGVTESQRHMLTSWTKSWLNPDVDMGVWLEIFLSSSPGKSKADQRHSVPSKPSLTYSSESPRALGNTKE